MDNAIYDYQCGSLASLVWTKSFLSSGLTSFHNKENYNSKNCSLALPLGLNDIYFMTKTITPNSK